MSETTDERASAGMDHLQAAAREMIDAARAFLDGMPDEETRTAAKRLIDPHLKGGAMDHGDTSHINDDDALEDGW